MDYEALYQRILRKVDEQAYLPWFDSVDPDTQEATRALSDLLRRPDFDPAERAFYYVRVLEIPTPRWTTHDAAFFGVDLPEGIPATQQDRAYTSPIWYTPAN